MYETGFMDYIALFAVWYFLIMGTVWLLRKIL